MQILYVEHDRNMHDRMHQMLGQMFSIHCVATVSEARQFLRDTLPDLLISEVCIGQESGLDLCRYIQETPALCQIPVMFLTSRATLQDKIAGFDAGADDYVVKPYDARHLQARIRLLLRIKKLEHR